MWRWKNWRGMWLQLSKLGWQRYGRAAVWGWCLARRHSLYLLSCLVPARGVQDHSDMQDHSGMQDRSFGTRVGTHTPCSHLDPQGSPNHLLGGWLILVYSIKEGEFFTYHCDCHGYLWKFQGLYMMFAEIFFVQWLYWAPILGQILLLGLKLHQGTKHEDPCYQGVV